MLIIIYNFSYLFQVNKYKQIFKILETVLNYKFKNIGRGETFAKTLEKN